MFKALCKADVVISVIVFALSLYLYLLTGTLGGGDVYGQLGPAYWPRFLLAILMFLSVLTALFSIRGVLAGLIPAAPPFHFTGANARFIAAASLIAGYIILLPYVGFLVLTPFMMIVFMYLLGERKKGWMFTLPFALTLGIVLMFTKVMYVPLPRGTGIFLSISHLLY